MTDTQETWDKIFEENSDNGAIDPNDKKGHKNRYIRILRDALFESWYVKTFTDDASPIIVDIGCGSGLSSKPLLDKGASIVGVDIAIEGLKIAPKKPNFLPVLTDGSTIPVKEESLDGAVSYVSLSYIEDDKKLQTLLEHLNRCCKKNSQLLFIEQCTGNSRRIPEQHKVQRTSERWATVFDASGFSLKRKTTLRCGHSPYLYLLKYGLITTINPKIGSYLEQMFEPILSRMPNEYLEVGFELEK